MTYLPNIPNATDDPSQSQSEIQGNFQAINTAFNLNHVSLGSGGSAGKHNFLEMPNQSSAPTTVSGEGALYTKSVTDHSTSGSQVFYQPDSSTGPGPYVYQLTRTVAPVYSTSFGTNPGWSFLPGNLLMQWGTNTTASGATITFPVPFSSACYSVQMTVTQNTTNRHFAYARSISTTSFTTTQLDSGGSGETNTFSWIAIGV